MSLMGKGSSLGIWHEGIEEDVRPLIEAALAALPADVSAATLSAVMTQLAVLDSSAESRRRANHRDLLSGFPRWFAVQDDDLRLLEAAAAVAAAAAAGLANPPSVLAGLVVLLWNYRRKRIELTDLQGLVLQSLRASPATGLREEEVRLALPLNDDTEANEVRRILEGLRAVRKGDGSTTALVDSKDGRWFAVKV